MNKMLSSWKEIAHFFGKGVRTVQRWEKTLDLPIRRPPGAPSNVVLARTSDLEEWMHRSSALREGAERKTDDLTTAIDELGTEVGKLVALHGVSNARNNDVDAAVDEPGDHVSRVRSITEEIRGLRKVDEHSLSELKKVA